MCKFDDLVIGLIILGISFNINLVFVVVNEIGVFIVVLIGWDGGKVKDIVKLFIIIKNDEIVCI